MARFIILSGKKYGVVLDPSTIAFLLQLVLWCEEFAFLPGEQTIRNERKHIPFFLYRMPVALSAKGGVLNELHSAWTTGRQSICPRGGIRGDWRHGTLRRIWNGRSGEKQTTETRKICHSSLNDLFPFLFFLSVNRARGTHPWRRRGGNG